jgi:hypothetical protein
MYIDASIERLDGLPVIPGLERRGCSREEIRALERELPDGLSLPAAYVEFLASLGHGSGFLLRGEDAFHAGVLAAQRQRRLEELMSSDRYEGSLNGVFAPDMLMIFQHHGGEFVRFVRLTEGDDPPVHWFEDAPDCAGHGLQHDSFSGYLRWQVERYAALHVETVRSRPAELLDRVAAYHGFVLELAELLAALDAEHPRPITRWLVGRYRGVAADVHQVYGHSRVMTSDVLVSATVTFAAENEDLPAERTAPLLERMHEAKGMAREVLALVDG